VFSELSSLLLAPINDVTAKKENRSTTMPKTPYVIVLQGFKLILRTNCTKAVKKIIASMSALTGF